MRVNMISRFVRQLSGQGALDNVSDVLATRRSVAPLCGYYQNS